MAIPYYEIYIGSITNPTFHFSRNEIKEQPSSIQNVDIIGDRLSVNSYSIKVYYTGPNIERLRTLPFGTPVWHYRDGRLVYKFYVKEIIRNSKIEFELSCVSVIGLLDKSSHVGGVYTGQPVSEVLAEIIGNIAEYTVDPDVAIEKVFGYLPYQSRRENLHQLLFAHNISILRNENGDMRFSYLRTENNPPEIDADRIYTDGNVEYPPLATEVTIIEHSYQYYENEDPVTLYDNTSSAPAKHKRIIFSTAPIYVPSLVTTDSLSIEVAHPNFAVVSGVGTLVGIPYYDNQSSISKENPRFGEEYSVAINDATLVNILNSENVSNRIMSYYSSSKIVKADIKVIDEMVGRRYTFLDAFQERVTGYLHKMTTYASSFIKATSEFVSGYESLWFGNNYSHYIEAIEPCDVIVPANCKRIRMIIIGGGEGGIQGTMSTVAPGANTDGQTMIDPSPGEPGKAGEPGKGGNIREVIIEEPVPGAYHCAIGVRGTGTSMWENNGFFQRYSPSESSVITPDGNVYSSGDTASYTCKSGVLNPFTMTTYGKRGREGIDGGRAGRGAYPKGEDGEDVYYEGVLYTGGKGATGLNFRFQETDKDLQVGGGGGDGAMAYIVGASAIPPRVTSYVNETASRGARDYEEVVFSESLTKTTFAVVPEVETERGCGGNAGCGGAGNSGAGSGGYLSDDYNDSGGKLVHRKATTYGLPSEITPNVAGERVLQRNGTPGRDGGRGIIIIYSDIELTIRNENKIPTPVITRSTANINTRLEFVASNLVPNTKYVIERKLMSSNAAVGEVPVQGNGINYRRWWQLTYMDVWEPRGTITTGANQQTLTIYEANSDQYPYRVITKSSYLYRMKSYGTENYGESEWSNEAILGFGQPYAAVNPIVELIPLYGGTGSESAPGILVYTGRSKPVYSSTAYENYERRNHDAKQWYVVGQVVTTQFGYTDWNVVPGQYVDYRLFVGTPNNLCSEYSNIESIIVPEVSTKLLPPYLVRLLTVDGSSIQQNLQVISSEFIFCDKRAEVMHLQYREQGRAWWKSRTIVNVAGFIEYHILQITMYIPQKTSSSPQPIEFVAYNAASGFTDSDLSNILTFTYPANMILTPQPFTAEYHATVDPNVDLPAVELNWGAVEHAAEFEIQRRKLGDTEWTSVYWSNETTVTTFEDMTITPGETYYYQILTTAEEGYYSATPLQLKVETTAGFVGGKLETPVLTSAYGGSGSSNIVLSWDSIDRASGYFIERKTGDGLWEIFEENLLPSTTSYIDTNTRYGVQYSYRVIALGDGEYNYDSEPSNVVTKTAINTDVIVLVAPQFVLSLYGSNRDSVRVSWSGVTNAKGYIIQRKLSSEGSSGWVTISLPYTAFSYIDPDVTVGETYDYRMKAVGNNVTIIDSSYSAVSSIEVPDSQSVLIVLDSTTLSLQQVAENNTVITSWSSVPEAIGYKLDRKLATNTNWETVYSGPALSYTDTNLTWDAEYDYKITVLGDNVTYADSVPTGSRIQITRDEVDILSDESDDFIQFGEDYISV